jgi:hypothetical protein
MPLPVLLGVLPVILLSVCVSQLAFDSEGIAVTSVMGFVKNPVSHIATQ